MLETCICLLLFLILALFCFNTCRYFRWWRRPYFFSNWGWRLSIGLFFCLNGLLLLILLLLFIIRFLLFFRSWGWSRDNWLRKLIIFCRRWRKSMLWRLNKLFFNILFFSLIFILLSLFLNLSIRRWRKISTWWWR